MNKIDMLKSLFFDEEEESTVTKRIEKRDDKFVVVSDDGKVLGTHDTRKEALEQLRAVEANKSEVQKFHVNDFFLEDADDDELRIALMQNEVDMERLKASKKKLENEIQERGITKSGEEDEVDSGDYDAPGRGNTDSPVVAFVGASPSKIDFIRDRPFSGLVGKTLQDTYISELDLSMDDVYMTNIVKEFCFDDERRPTDPSDEKIAEAIPDFVDEMNHIKPRFIVALGKTAKNAIGEISEEWVPHPRAINMNSDSGEVERKMSRLKKRIAKPDHTWEGKLIKSEDEEKQIVYGVVMEPFENDTDGNWTTPEEIEDAAHVFVKNFRSIDTEHNREDINAAPVESWIQREDTEIGGQEVKAGSWVMGVKVEDEGEWEAIKSGEYSGFSIDAVARIDPNLLLM